MNRDKFWVKNDLFNLLLLTFISTQVLMLHGMRHCIIKASPDQKIIEDYHGEIFTVPALTIEKCNLFHYMNDYNDDFDFEKTDTWDQLFSKRFPKRDFSFFQRTATDTPLSKEILKTAFECIEQPKECKSLPKEQIRSVFAAVNFLSPNKEKVAKKLGSVNEI